MNKNPFSIQLFYSTFFSLCFVLANCDQPEPKRSEQVIDRYKSEHSFSEADQLKYKQDYEKAALAYEAKLEQLDLSVIDSIYLFNQITYCRLIVNSTKSAQENIGASEHLLKRIGDGPTSLMVDHFFNKGRYYFLQNLPDSSLHYAQHALKGFYQIYPKGHLKTAQTLNLLSLIHLADGNLTDSIHYYSLQANNMFLNNPAIQTYDWENDYILGYASLLIRAHERGAFYCRATLRKIDNLPFENPWLEARAKNLLAQMLKKQAYWLIGEDSDSLKIRKEKLYTSADSLFQEAISIGKSIQDPGLMNFYIDWIINTCRFSDSTLFFQAMEAFKEQFSTGSIWKPHYERLLGYYYFGKDSDKAIKHYGAFLETAGDHAQEIDYRIFADSYYCLRMAHREQGNFAKSAHFAKKSLQLYNCIGEEVDINQVNAISQLDSTNRSCLTVSGFFAEGVLKKYYLEKKLDDLQLANVYFDFIEQHSFKTLLNKDEDAFLTFQVEAGSRIYAKALDAATEAWTVTKNNHWLDKAFNYMEYLKSYLLYRDMLKENQGHEQGYSLSDSIRLLQGQVNQLLFSLRAEEVEISDDLYSKKLVNKLNSLEHRRSAKLDSFTVDIHRNQIEISDVQQHLASRQGVVNFYNSNDQQFSIYLDRDTVIFCKLEQGYPIIKQAIQDYRNSIEKEVKLDEATFQQYLKAGRTLYQALIGSFSKRLSNIDQLVVIPDQLLDPVPFEALLSEEVDSDNFSFKSLPYLLHQVQVVYTSSWKVFKQNQSKVQANFSNKSIGFWTTPELSTINGLQIIEKSIQSSFGRDNYQIFSQAKGGKQFFSGKHVQFDILHLLLHASSSKVNRHDNLIRFGGTAHDIMYGFELSQEKFQSKLVVLASCESATGAPQAGEGTFSLARSFINSGVPEIVAAQFLIPQTTTGPLLSRFYQHLGKGHTASSALHTAKIEYLKTISKDRHAYPRFWAGMVIFN